jgi:hypothetical protein
MIRGRLMPKRSLIAFLSGLAVAIVLVILARALDWSDRTLLVAGAVSAFVFAAIAAPTVLARPRPKPFEVPGQLQLLPLTPEEEERTFPLTRGVTTRLGNGS